MESKSIEQHAIGLPEEHDRNRDEDAHTHGEKTHYDRFLDLHDVLRGVHQIKGCEPSIRIRAKM